MRKPLVLLFLLAALTACSDEARQQVASTAGMGSALGAPGGPIGVAVGAVLGAAVGAILPPGSFDTAKTEDANGVPR